MSCAGLLLEFSLAIYSCRTHKVRLHYTYMKLTPHLLGTVNGSSKSGCDVTIATSLGADFTYFTLSFSAVNSLWANSAVDKNSCNEDSAVTDCRFKRPQSKPSLTSVVCSWGRSSKQLYRNRFCKRGYAVWAQVKFMRLFQNSFVNFKGVNSLLVTFNYFHLRCECRVKVSSCRY